MPKANHAIISLAVNDFQRRKIRKNLSKKLLSDTVKQNILTALGILVILGGVYYSAAFVFEKIGGTRLVQLLSGLVGKSLETDAHGHTNILLLGIGGEGHDGKDLTDTIMIASLDEKNSRVGMISLPRDLYVNSTLGGSRINHVYEQAKQRWGSSQGLEFAIETTEKIFEIDIQYVVKVDFKAFEEIIDAIGGVDVYVDQAIHDTQYPKDGTYGYETFTLGAGLQHLDGKTALKYARSRKTSSDFDRSARQQKLLVAIKNKMKNIRETTRTSLLKNLYGTLRDHVETTFSLREMISLLEFGVSFDTKNIRTATLTDEPSYVGGFLYTPMRELFNGAFVLLPAGDDFTEVNRFIQLVLFGGINPADAGLAILNGTKTSGVASGARAGLHRFGIGIVHVGNATSQAVSETSWYLKNENSRALVAELQKLLPGKIIVGIPGEYAADPDFVEAKIILELGKDSVPFVEKLDIFRNVVQLTPAENKPEITAPLAPVSSKDQTPNEK